MNIKLKKELANIVNKSKFLSFLHVVYFLIFRPKRVAIVINPTFRGWGMATTARLPWEAGCGYSVAKNFSRADALLKEHVRGGKFILSQFKEMFPDFDENEFLNELNWRHYMVYWSSTFAVKNTDSQFKRLAECGVCDGLSIFYAINAAKDMDKTYGAYLYDAWGAMREDLLMESEKDFAGDYEYLSMQATQKNLSMFEASTLFFNRGYIPESFNTAQNPESIVWLHIDLNAAKATIAALDFFWGKLENGGVVLFDDYAHPGYEDTRRSIDEWIETKKGTLLHLPTGQAVVIKDKC